MARKVGNLGRKLIEGPFCFNTSSGGYFQTLRAIEMGLGSKKADWLGYLAVAGFLLPNSGHQLQKRGQVGF